MDELTLKTFVFGKLFNNCYLIFSRKSKQGFIIDCPAHTEELDKFVRSQNLEILFIALTHAHFDHIGGLSEHSFPFYIHRNDVPLLSDPQLNGSLLFDSPVTVEKEYLLYEEGKPLYFGTYSIEIIHTPGHTPGSVSLKLNNWIFSGDVLFLDSIGRTDIPLASHNTLIKSIKEKILTLPPETIVYPGHGPSTTVGREKKYNPFCKDGYLFRGIY